MSKIDNYESETNEVVRLGNDWFNFESDISEKELEGHPSKEYVFRLGYQDEFIVRVYYVEKKQIGASMLYTPTMMKKFTKNANLAFKIGKQMKERTRMLNSLMR